MGHIQLLWATVTSASLPSQGRISQTSLNHLSFIFTTSQIISHRLSASPLQCHYILLPTVYNLRYMEFNLLLVIIFFCQDLLIEYYRLLCRSSLTSLLFTSPKSLLYAQTVTPITQIFSIISLGSLSYQEARFCLSYDIVLVDCSQFLI